ncbi:transcriptional regulator [Halobacteriales archaeon QH_7_65_31]|nr:MAG: transcriptional regulator [Halobacteriales archaeon QH_7_65_31]
MRRECLVVEISVEGDGCPLADASTDARIEAAPPLRRTDGHALLRFSTPERAVGDRLDADDRIRYLHGSRATDRPTYRCLAKERCVVHDLIDVGFLPESSTFEGGSERHLGAVVGRDVLEGVLEAAGETVGVGIERITPLGEERDDPTARQFDLTPAQERAIRVAHAAGYFTIPREADAGEVAAELGISKSAFLERLRRGQAALFDGLL